MQKDLLEQFQPMFYPRGIAVVGASKDERKMGHAWVRGLIRAGFRGKVYAVNPNEDEVLGLKTYPDVKSTPGPVDLAIVCIPRRFALALLDDCAAKGVKAVHFFTGGFRETGRPEDRALEDEVVEKARQTGIRVIGPNCVGIYNPEARIPWGPSDLLGEPGNVGLVSQSGGHAGKVAEIGLVGGIRFSKVVSYGNGADLDGADFIEYLGVDPRTEVIGAYMEGSSDGRKLMNVISRVTRTKPVVVWKAGRTWSGAEAASSHTGSMVASADVWSAALRQSGAIEVAGIEELTDTLLLFQQVKRLAGNRLGVVCGLTDGGGGESVLSADACASHGVEVPRFLPETREKLAAIFGEVGSVLRNPLDVSQGYGDVDKLRRGMELVYAEPQVDILVVYENADILGRFLSQDVRDGMNALFIEFSRRHKKPVIAVLPPGSAEESRLNVKKSLLGAGMPVFDSMDRAACAIANVYRYSARGGKY